MIAPAASAPPPTRMYRIKQAIFHGVAAADRGARVVFASLTDGRCALLLDDRLVAAWGNDVYGIDVGVREYLEMTGAAPRLPQRQRAGPSARSKHR